jgi:hypothetical protein
VSEIIARQEKTLRREAYSEIDKKLVSKSDKQHVVDLTQEKPQNEAQRVLLQQERTRLAFLADLGLATKLGEDKWQLYRKLPSELYFRAANREFAPEWRKPQEHPTRIHQQNRERHGQVVRVVESERMEGRER